MVPQGVENLFDRLDRMTAYGPVFCDITWGAGGTTADVTLDIAVRMQNHVRTTGAAGGPGEAGRRPACGCIACRGAVV